MEIKEDGQVVFGLDSPQQVVNIVKEQVEKERGRRPGPRLESAEPLEEGSI